MPKSSITIESKLPNVSTTIFTIMSKMANETGAVNLSQGFPNFPVSEELIKLVNKHMTAGRNQYAPMPGVPELRNAISNKVKSLYNRSYNPETEIVVTAGATQAIYTAIDAVVQPGDEVIIFSPAYDCYEPAIELNDAKTISISLSAPSYSVPWDEVKKAISTKTKMIITNTPHNPTGTIWGPEDLATLDEITRGTDIIVLSDEVYEHIIFDGEQHQSAALNVNLSQRSFIVASFGKTFHATGWKTGYILGPEGLMKEFKKVHQYNVFSCNAPVQYALAEYIENEENYLSLGSFYQEKRDLFLSEINGSRFEWIPSKGTYFQLLSYKNISSENDVDLAQKWTRENGIASIPISVFYPNGEDEKMLRFCFAKDSETIINACKILKSL